MFDNVLSLGNDVNNSLFSGVCPDYYACGVYGWNYDCYSVNRNAVIMGYRTHGNVVSAKLRTKYDKKAIKINDSRFLKYETKQKKLAALREKFVQEAILEQ